jgi:tetratricopeptide (TPR) repeat protein
MGAATAPAISTLAASARAGLLAGGGLAPLLPLWLWWALDDGGYSPAVWLPGLPLLAAAVCVLAFVSPRPALSGARAWALAALAALAAWTWLSATWATDPGVAVLEAERRSLYLAAFALPLLWPPSRSVLAGAVIALPAVALAGLVAAFAGAFGGDALSDGRLAGPFLYPNALAALLATGAVVSFVLAAHREATPALRALAWAAGGVLAAGVLLTQSRGGIAALAAICAGALILAPFRSRLVAPMLAAAAGCVLASGPLLAVRTAAIDGSADTALVEAAAALVAVAAALAAVALASAFLARGAIAERANAWLAAARARGLPRPGRLLAAVALVAVAVGLAAGSPREWVEERVADFNTRDYDRIESGETRLTGGLGSHRSDYWRVSLETAAAAPVGGAGAGGFRASYLEGREASTSPQYAHGIWFGTLADLGIAGAAMLLALGIAITAAEVAAIQRAAGSAQVVRFASLVPLAYLAVHASADWVGAFPALAVPALGLAGAGLAAAERPARAVGGRRPDGARPRPRLAVAAAVVASLLAIASVPLMQSERLTSSALAANASGAPPGGILAALESAEDWNPLAAQPALARGLVCAELGRLGCAHDAFEIAASRNPSGWVEQLELGLIAGAAGDRAEARARLAEANRLNPRGRLVDRGLATLAGEGSVTARRAATRLLAQEGLSRSEPGG